MRVCKDIGESIVCLRKMRGYTQEKLALECNIAVSYLRLIEHGRANPTIEELTAIVGELGSELTNPIAIPEQGK